MVIFFRFTNNFWTFIGVCIERTEFFLPKRAQRATISLNTTLFSHLVNKTFKPKTSPMTLQTVKYIVNFFVQGKILIKNKRLRPEVEKYELELYWKGEFR